MVSFVVKKNKFDDCKIVDQELPELAENQVLLQIDQFSLTSNNITYAVTGDTIGYWGFFPAIAEYGIIPVWGFADVTASNNENIKVGERYYGYYPMASHLIAEAGKINRFGFTDIIAHRSVLPPLYNFYTRTSSDPLYTKDTEGAQSIYRPLFTTSFLIDDLLSENDFFGAKNIILTSASSKTAQALAFLLAQRKQHGSTTKVTALTSTRNVDFVKQLESYDETLDYSQLDQLKLDEGHVIVDFTGNHELQYNLQVRLGDQLKYNCLVGLVDWQHAKGEQRLPKKGNFFFAPSYAMTRQKDWGVAGFTERLGKAWIAFVQAVKDDMTFSDLQGRDAIKQLYLNTLTGNIDPSISNLVNLNE